MAVPSSPLFDAPRVLPERCTSCHAELATPVACSGCHTIFAAPEGLSHFERLGLPERFEVDLREAERKFLDLSRELHPDFFTTRSAAEQALSLEHSAHLNDAIRVIRDPFSRAAYLMQRWCPQDGDDRDQHLPGGFLEDMLFIREEIEDAVDADASPEREAALDAFRDDLTARREAQIGDLAALFTRVEAVRPHMARAAADLTAIRRTLNAARYITGTLNHLREART